MKINFYINIKYIMYKMFGYNVKFIHILMQKL